MKDEPVAIISHERHKILAENSASGQRNKTIQMRNACDNECEVVGSTNDLQSASLEQPEPSPLTGVRVLIVDDDEWARDLVALILAQAGAQTQTAASVSEAISVFAMLEPNQYPDVLISDLSMPDEDGYALIRQLRQRAPEKGGRIPAIALTALGRRQDRIQVLRAGFQTHITKPVEAEELVMVITNLVSSPSGHRQSFIK